MPILSGGSGLEGMVETAEYLYTDESGAPLYKVIRFEDPKGVKPKTFRQKRPVFKNGSAGWKWGADGVRRVPFHLPMLLQGVAGEQTILVVEGEKDVVNLEKLGFVATCNSGGAGNWDPEHAKHLCDANVIVLPDNDQPGRLHAESVARSIDGSAGRIRLLRLPGLPEKGDASDWLSLGGTKEKLIELARACTGWERQSEYDEALAKCEANSSEHKPERTAPTEEDKAKAGETIEAAITQGTATAIYDDSVITAIAILDEGERADIVQKICATIKSVTKRDIKKMVAEKRLELNPVTFTFVPPDGMVGLVLSPNIPVKESCGDALDALVEHNDPKRIFRRGGRMSRIRPTDQGTMKIEELEKEGIAYELGTLVDFCFINPNDGSERHVTTPKFIIDYLYAHPDLPFPVIDGITEIPVLRSDGTILDSPGYDEATKLYYHPPDDLELPPIPDVPTDEDRREAAELLREVFCDMPFLSEADRTHTIALLLSPILRQLTRTTPLALMNAHQPSNGKSLIGDAISLIITGRNANNATAPIESKEWESFLGALLFAGEPLVFFDNVKHTVSDAALEKVLTSKEVTNRVLGKSTALTVTNRITFAMTGNNIQVGREIARRSYMINLDAGISNPEDRPVSSYRHPELREWIRENRGRIVWALFVIIRAWFADGQPTYELPHMGSFERWTRLVGNILTHAGFGGFLANRNKLRADADQESAQWEAFLSRWRELYGDEARSIADIAPDLTSDAHLGGVIPEDLSRCIKGYETNNVRIGKVFKKREGCRFGPRQFRLCQGTIIRGQRMWTVLEEMDLSVASEQADQPDREARDILAAPPDGSEPRETPVFGVNSLDLALLPDEWEDA
ncbi:MAG: toprim domain-containing protein [Armatimonadetes bacterium]|nr:toprim domain-containing protein [Armatimonadota bacterium]